VVVWTDNSMDFTKALSKFYKQRVEELGGNVVLEDFSAQIARLKNASPKADAEGWNRSPRRRRYDPSDPAPSP
jgi:hypothetical protein